LAYFATIVALAPLSILTGAAMSPALVNRFPAYARFFGGRQAARSLHFLLLVAWILFVASHVFFVAMTGFRRNMNHIVLGTDNDSPMGMTLGFIGIAVVLLTWVAAHYISWYFPRGLQHAQKAIMQPVQLLTLDRLIPRARYAQADISPHFWPNGKMPERQDWHRLAGAQFKDYKLKISGLVENPVELSLNNLRALGVEDHITMHHCIQGWSGIAHWKGISLRAIIDLVKPLPYAKTVVFYSFGEGLFGGVYYDTQSIYNARKQQCILAFEMNGQPLPLIYGAPLRLRVEDQLGYKMVKWIERIEFIESEQHVGKGEGGKNEDDEYFDLLPNI
jgi:DMSO/TMAO reductase YedYZ molybdopterin-dependent catalytic subunit